MRCIADGTERSAGTVAGQRPRHRALPAVRVRRARRRPQVPDRQRVRHPDRGRGLRIARTRLAPAVALARAPTRSTCRKPALQVMRGHRPRPAARRARRAICRTGMKQALELAMVLALEPSVLLLDEPTAGLTKPERTLIGSILVDLARNHELCILLVEHDLDFVREISSRVIVLHQGTHRARRHGRGGRRVRAGAHHLFRRRHATPGRPRDRARARDRRREQRLRRGGGRARRRASTSRPARSSRCSARTAWARARC